MKKTIFYLLSIALIPFACVACEKEEEDQFQERRSKSDAPDETVELEFSEKGWNDKVTVEFEF